MGNINKMDTSAVFEMFETISKKLDKQATDNSTESILVDLTAVNGMTERFEKIIEEVCKPVNVKHHHKIEIDSNWFFFSWIGLAIVILALFWAFADQRETINQFKENDLKYRYIKMNGQTNEESLHRLEQQFLYDDSIKIVRKQVERYEELVREQAERIERARRNREEVEKLEEKVKTLKNINVN